MIKYFRVWALKIRQVIIASKRSIHKWKQGAKLLDKWPIKTATSSRITK